MRRLGGAKALITSLMWTAAATAAPPMLTQLPIGEPTRAQRQAPLVLDAVTDTATGEQIRRIELARRLNEMRLLFIGEEHTNLEMYPYTEQGELERWMRADLDEADFVRTSAWYENWSHHWGYYRDIFLYVKANKIGLYGINVPSAN